MSTSQLTAEGRIPDPLVRDLSLLPPFLCGDREGASVYFRVREGIGKKCKKAKWLSGEALQIAVKTREVKSKREKERYKHLNAEFQRIARRDKESLPQQSMQRNSGK